jgi:hypothetical protein
LFLARFHPKQSAKGMDMRLLKDNGLTIVLLMLFAVCIAGQYISGWYVELEDSRRHAQPSLTLFAYAASPQFLSSVFENWESEFLQMAAYVVLTAFLIQRGSAESKDPDAPPRDNSLDQKTRERGAPWILRKGPLWRAIYARSLGLALILLFLASFTMHWINSARAAAQEALEHGETPTTVLAYLGDAQLWFESFQNWQSEFLSTAVLVVLSIFLRQRESPESKPVAAPNSQTGD